MRFIQQKFRNIFILELLQRSCVQPSERLASIGIIVTQLRPPGHHSNILARVWGVDNQDRLWEFPAQALVIKNNSAETRHQVSLAPCFYSLVSFHYFRIFFFVFSLPARFFLFFFHYHRVFFFTFFFIHYFHVFFCCFFHYLRVVYIYFF